MNWSIRWRLCLMMFLQYGAWGAWAVTLGAYLGSPPKGGNPSLYLSFDPNQVGVIFSLLPLATVIAPFVFGQLADRLLSTQYLLSICHVFAGVIMFTMGLQQNYGPFMLLMLGYSLLYAPTLALTNSLAFAHMRDSEREFGGIRVFGTIGWMVAGYMLTGWRVINTMPGDLLFLAAGFSIALGLFSLALPNTPPKREGSNPLAFLEALKLFKNTNFAVFMAISFVVGTELEFYYILTSPYLEHLGISRNMVPTVMTLAQFAELFVMWPILPWLMPKLGARKLLAIGAIAWPIRYAIFAFIPNAWVASAALPLHGICYVFFFVVGFIYVDQVAPKDIRASAQALVAIVVLGLGRFLGSRFAGLIQDYYTTRTTGPDGQIIAVTQWQPVFLVPCIMTVICAIAFVLFFRDERANKNSTAEPETVAVG